MTGKPSLAGGRGGCGGCAVFFVHVWGDVEGVVFLCFGGAVAVCHLDIGKGLHDGFELGGCGEMGCGGDICFVLAVTTVFEGIMNALVLQIEAAKTWVGYLMAFCHFSGNDDGKGFQDQTDGGLGDAKLTGDIGDELWKWIVGAFVARHEE